MVKHQMRWLRFLGVMVVILMSVGLAEAQAPRPAGPPPEGPEMDEGPGGPGRPGPGHGKERGPRDPELDKRVDAIHMTAQAYIQMAEMFEKAGKTDESIAQLQKIISLHESVAMDTTLPEGLRKDWSRKILQIQLRIAKAYVKQNKMKEAESLLLEASKKADQSELKSKLILELANISRDQGKLEEAQKLYQQVIDNNASLIIKK